VIYSHVTAEGKVNVIESDAPLPLEKLQELVGGYIEFTYGGLGLTICVDEEGRIKGKPRNARYPWVVGDVVVGRNIQGAEGTEFVGLI
jgi:hypothetical protein